MSRQDGGRDPKTLKHVFVKYEGRDLKLIMPPMDEEAELVQHFISHNALKCYKIHPYGSNLRL